jgi:DNA-binding transcriptional regulator YhcF (GntR family)
MFVAAGAREALVKRRQKAFSADFVRPLVAEATKLSISPTQLADMIKKEAGR